jgi:hypothetical protein
VVPSVAGDWQLLRDALLLLLRLQRFETSRLKIAKVD